MKKLMIGVLSFASMSLYASSDFKIEFGQYALGNCQVEVLEFPHGIQIRVDGKGGFGEVLLNASSKKIESINSCNGFGSAPNVTNRFQQTFQ